MKTIYCYTGGFELTIQKAAMLVLLQNKHEVNLKQPFSQIIEDHRKGLITKFDKFSEIIRVATMYHGRLIFQTVDGYKIYDTKQYTVNYKKHADLMVNDSKLDFRPHDEEIDDLPF
jgi:hypothetical protein